MNHKQEAALENINEQLLVLGKKRYLGQISMQEYSTRVRELFNQAVKITSTTKTLPSRSTEQHINYFKSSLKDIWTHLAKKQRQQKK